MKEKLTKCGIAYDFNISPYKVTIEYPENDEMIYTFSSNFYKEKFMDMLDDNRKKINDSLTKRFGINIEFNILADIKLYSTIEKRGFLIEDKKGKFECLNIIRLDGKIMI